MSYKEYSNSQGENNNNQGENNGNQGNNNGNQGENNNNQGNNNGNQGENNGCHGEMECRSKCFELDAGNAFAVKVIELSVPVSIKPVAIAHTPVVTRLGECKVEPGLKECHGKCECGKIDFTLTQKISVTTPVEFKINEFCGKLCVEEE